MKLFFVKLNAHDSRMDSVAPYLDAELEGKSGKGSNVVRGSIIRFLWLGNVILDKDYL